MEAMNRTIALLASAVVALLAASPANAQPYKAGDKVMVKRWQAKLTEGGQELKTRVELGDIFIVGDVSGQLLAVERGWIHTDDVVPYDQAIAYFTDQIQKRPNSTAYHNRAWALEKMRQYDKAIEDEDNAILLNPDAASYNNRGIIWRHKRKYDQALADFNTALSLDPNYVNAHLNRGGSYVRLRDYSKAKADYEEAARLAPEFVGGYAEGAWLLATCPDEQIRDGKTAVELALRACALDDWRNPSLLDTLAAAYAAKGDFQSAISWQSRALDTPLGQNSGKKAEKLRARLELYKSGKLYLENPDDDESDAPETSE